jgi:hypothetical protein
VRGHGRTPLAGEALSFEARGEEAKEMDTLADVLLRGSISALLPRLV